MARSIYIWSYLILKHTFLGRYSQFADGKTLDSEELEKFFKIILLVGEQSGLEIQFCWLLYTTSSWAPVSFCVAEALTLAN